MNRTEIDWADMTWNPVTGCKHGCPYCYAAQIARRFGGCDAARGNSIFKHPGDGLHILDEPALRAQKNGKFVPAPFPFYFEPTCHRYRMGDPIRAELPRNIFVCSMADLFGSWVPVEWIVQVMNACLAAPQHNYLFLTKNPARYMELDRMAMLPRKGNFWYGSTVTDGDAPYFYSDQHNTFISIEPMQGPMHGTGNIVADWVIVGAETGNRKGKTRPEREWVLSLADECRSVGVPIFMKRNLVRENVLEIGDIIQQRPEKLTFA